MQEERSIKPNCTQVQDGTANKPKSNNNSFVSLIQNHYGNTHCTKSPEQIEAESWLIPGLVPYSRWFCMPAGVVPQFCAGSVYAWSVFNKPIELQIFGEVNNTAPITFTIAIGCLGLSAAVMGPWLERNGPRKACLLGTSLFFAGNITTALALYLKQLWLVFLGYGVIGGFGIGLCYISPVSALQKWFPDHRGLASGVAVCGFGAGSIAMAKVQGVLLELIGLPMTFVTLGCSYFVIMVISSFVLRTPPPGYSVTVIPDPEGTINNHIEMEPPKDQNQQTLKLTEQDLISLPQALSSRDFRLLYIAFLSNILFGLVLISRMSNMVTDIFLQPTTSATTAVSLNGAFNLFGRLFFSLSSDYVGRKNTYVLMLTTQLAILASFHFITTARAYPAFLATMWTLTMCYGGGFSLIPAFLADKFGPKNVGATHGVILTAWSIAGVAGGLIFTTVFNSLINSGEYEMNDPFLYNVNAYWILAVVGTGWTCILLVEPTERDRKFLKWIMCRN